jgi:dTDP-4-amino-4,6-dideoxygalactose transaminase
MNELQAAFGLLQLKHIDKVIQQRKAIDSTYRKELSSVTGIEFLPEPAATTSNYSYFPILVTELYHKSRDELYQQLKDNNVFARRYFYPLISDMPMYRELPSAAAENLPAAEKIAQQVICLPIHAGMNEDLAIQVAGMIST